MKIIHSSERVVSSWSGGTTEELFIYPEKASYAARDFGIRISTATIEIEESQFTSLPDFQRILMILNGSIRIVHEGQYEKTLNPFEQDHFSGAWATNSLGKARDFNVIYREEFKPEVNCVFLQNNELFELTDESISVIFILEGEMKNDDTIFKENDVIILENEIQEFNVTHSSKLIIVTWSKYPSSK